MAYSTYLDVLEASGLKTLSRVVSLYDDPSVNDSIVQDMIEKMIEEVDQEIKGQLHIPITVHEEMHVVDEDIGLTKVYFGSYDETYCGHHVLDVQECVTAVMVVWVNGIRVKTTDDNYPWTWTTPNGYIEFTDGLSDGDIVKITYEYDPYAVSVPANVRKASKYLAAAELIDHLIGLRQSATAFESQGDSGERIPDREALFNSRASLRKAAEDAMASIGYGFEFDPIKG